MKCHSVQALWASSPPVHQVVAMAATHNPPSLWTGGSGGEIMVWKLPSLPPSAVDTALQDLLPIALLCGHSARVVALVTCGLDWIMETKCNATCISRVDRDDPHSYGVIVSVCMDGWICAWDPLIKRCQRRRKLPEWLGTPNSMAALLGTKCYVAIACHGSDAGSSKLAVTNEGDMNVRKLIDNAKTMALEGFGGTANIVAIVDTLLLGLVRVVSNDMFSAAPARAIVAVTEANSVYKIMISDPGGRIQAWKISLKGEQTGITTEGEQDKYVTDLPTAGKTAFFEDAKCVSFSPDGLYVLLVYDSKWIVASTEDLSLVHEPLKSENNQRNTDWSEGFFLTERYRSVYTILIWDIHGGGTFYVLQSTSETISTEEVCWIPPFQTDGRPLSCFKYYQFYNTLVCITCGYGSQPQTPDVRVRLWVLQRSLTQVSSVHHTDHMEHISPLEQISCSLYACGDLRTPWVSFASSLFSLKVSVEKETVHADALQEESMACSSQNEWVTASMVLFDNSIVPWGLVLGFSHGVIQLIGFQTSLQEGKNGFSVENGYNCTIEALSKHSAPVVCLAQHTILRGIKGGQTYLLSGGMDCLTCIWNLNDDRGQLLVTLHHHVAPIRQILLPPPGTYPPWSNCFLTIGEDGSIALVSLETLQVERMFVGHPSQPKQIAWDGTRGYLSCLCFSVSLSLNDSDVLFIWDMKSGALERVLRGASAQMMYINIVHQIKESTLTTGSSNVEASSTASLLHGEVDPSLPLSVKESQTLDYHLKKRTEGDAVPILSSKPNTNETILRPNLGDSSSSQMIGGFERLSSRLSQVLNQGTKAAVSESKDNSSVSMLESSSRTLFHKQPPIKSASPIPGVVALQFDLFTLMAPDLGRMGKAAEKESEIFVLQNGTKATGPSKSQDKDDSLPPNSINSVLPSSLGSTAGYLLRTSLAFLHLWEADHELDKCLQEEWQITKPLGAYTAAGFAGDKGATTLLLPGWEPTFEMWTLSAEFCALRSLTLVATALRMATLFRHTPKANSALAAFYTRGLAEKYPEVKAPTLELYACFWQDPSEHVRMAARSLFHCAVSRAIPPVLRAMGYPGTLPDAAGKMEHGNINTADSLLRLEEKLVSECAHEKPIWPDSVSSSAEIIDWLESYESQLWTEVVEGTNQDARAGRIIVASALAVWYPCLVKPELAPSVAPYLVKLVKAMVDRHSAIAAELLGDGMESVWRHLIADEIPQLICDVFLLIECLSGGVGTKHTLVGNPATAMTIRETLTGSLLPSLAMADVVGFLKITQAQLSSATPTSSGHLVSLMTTIRIIRGAPRSVVYHLSQIVSIILQTMNTGRHCHQTAMAAIREMARIFPMVALHQNSGKLAVGDAAGDVHSLAIHVYDLNSSSKLRDLDASGPPGHPALLPTDITGSSDAGGISALAFSEDGEGVVAFSQHGLMIRSWSLSAVWWEKLTRVHTPLQCNKLVLVPPWSGFSPKSSRSSIMATISNNSNLEPAMQESRWQQHDDNIPRLGSPSIDLSFRLEWKAGMKIALLHHNQELGLFQL